LRGFLTGRDEMGRELVFTGPREVGFRDYPEPALGAGEARLATLFSGISHGTEMNMYRGTAPNIHKGIVDGLFTDEPPADGGYPFTYGYEEVGEVVELGPGVTNVRVGERFALSYGHRTDVVLPADSLTPSALVPPSFPAEQAVFKALGGVAMDAYVTSQIRLGESAVIFGLGVIGLFLVQLCKRGGVEPVIAVDPLAGRRALAREFGADLSLDPAAEEVAVRVRKELGRTGGADVVFETSGSYRALQEGIRSGAPGHSILMAVAFYQGDAVGLRLGEEFHHGGSLGRGGCVEIRINNSRVDRARGRRWDRDRTIGTFYRWLLEGKLRVDNLITHRFAFRDAPAAFALIDQHPEQCLKCILCFD
jgi:threonine dehydrogenase-like Zn-dependent dehydrogenase